MVADRTEIGFTVAEMVVTLVVLGIFLTLFFQLYLTSESQRIAVVRRAAANDLAMTNLRKISSRATIPASTTGCQDGASSVNNLADNPTAVGSIIATNATSGITVPTWTTAGLAAELTTDTNLPSGTGTIQELRVFYPNDCDIAMPAKIISTITYGSESVSRAAFVN